MYVSWAFPCCVNGFAAWFLSLGEEALAHPTEAGKRKKQNCTSLRGAEFSDPLCAAWRIAVAFLDSRCEVWFVTVLSG